MSEVMGANLITPTAYKYPEMSLNEAVDKDTGIVGFIVLDAETTSLKPNASILTFCASFYNFGKYGLLGLEDDSLLEQTVLKLAPDVTEQYLLGSDFSKSTQEWHIKQNENVLEILNGGYERVTVKDFFNKVSEFINLCKSEIDNIPGTNYNPEDIMIFCRHTHADWVWMEQLAQAAKITNPISYKEIMDVSSFVSGVKRKKISYLKHPTREGFPKHDALGDVKNDITTILLALQ